jgi:IclR family acetate operon transcriptional repressor
MTNQQNAATNLQNASRVVQTIEALAERQPMRLDDLADELGVHKSNVLRLLATLRNHGWVTVNDNRTLYSLGPRLVAVGQAAVPDIELAKALELADQLRDLTGETVHISVPSGMRMLVVGKVESLNALRVSFEVGSEDLLHCTAVGKMALASMPDDELRTVIEQLDLTPATPNTITDRTVLYEHVVAARENGYAMNLEEGRLDTGSVAFSLSFGGTSQPFSLSITGPIGRWSKEAIEARLPEMFTIVAPYQYVGP